jgi:hypothetical protein
MPFYTVSGITKEFGIQSRLQIKWNGEIEYHGFSQLLAQIKNASRSDACQQREIGTV